jgi:hypothetical protein
MDDPSNQPEFEPDIIKAQVDQIMAMSTDMARAYKAMYDACIDVGFNDMQALALVMHVFNPNA